jgi:hypothetical protein
MKVFSPTPTVSAREVLVLFANFATPWRTLRAKNGRKERKDCLQQRPDVVPL